MNHMRLTILASSSAGNCAYLETENTRLLIDCGLRASKIRKRLAGIGRTPESLDAILITHEHNDHIQGLAGLCAKINASVFCKTLSGCALRFAGFVQTPSGSYEIGDIIVETFSLPHDAEDPVGFILSSQGSSVAFVTDCAFVPSHVIQRLRGVNVLVLETNHDINMLWARTDYVESLKRRISGPLGHLRNESAADVLEQVMTPELRHVFMAHLSLGCNTPELARAVLQNKLDEIGASHVTLHHTFQDKACETLEF